MGILVCVQPAFCSIIWRAQLHSVLGLLCLRGRVVWAEPAGEETATCRGHTLPSRKPWPGSDRRHDRRSLPVGDHSVHGSVVAALLRDSPMLKDGTRGAHILVADIHTKQDKKYKIQSKVC